MKILHLKKAVAITLASAVLDDPTYVSADIVNDYLGEKDILEFAQAAEAYRDEGVDIFDIKLNHYFDFRHFYLRNEAAILKWLKDNSIVENNSKGLVGYVADLVNHHKPMSDYYGEDYIISLSDAAQAIYGDRFSLDVRDSVIKLLGRLAVINIYDAHIKANEYNLYIKPVQALDDYMHMVVRGRPHKADLPLSPNAVKPCPSRAWM